MLKMTWYFNDQDQLALRWDSAEVALTVEQKAQARALFERAYPDRETSIGRGQRSLGLRTQDCGRTLSGRRFCLARRRVVGRRIS